MSMWYGKKFKDSISHLRKRIAIHHVMIASHEIGCSVISEEKARLLCHLTFSIFCDRDYLE